MNGSTALQEHHNGSARLDGVGTVVAVVSAQLAASDRGGIRARALRLSALVSSDDFGSSVVRRLGVKCYPERVFRMPWEHGGWARDRALGARNGFRCCGEIGSRPQARRGDAVSATVLHMSEVPELWEALHGA
jgi:hypothetical protein